MKWDPWELNLWPLPSGDKTAGRRNSKIQELASIGSEQMDSSRPLSLERKISSIEQHPSESQLLSGTDRKSAQLKPTAQFSFNVNHSSLVAWTRVKLEQLSIASFWRSERRLISEDLPIQRKTLMSKMKVFIPDGVYSNSSDKKRDL
jgi:hypothetical protein